jgi:hypothetical protein
MFDTLVEKCLEMKEEGIKIGEARSLRENGPLCVLK